jgi:hypothetical protein
VIVFAASITDNNAGIAAVNQTKADHPTIVKTWVDTGFKNKFVEHAATLGIDAEVVRRNEQVPASPCCRAAGSWRELSDG